MELKGRVWASQIYGFASTSIRIHSMELKEYWIGARSKSAGLNPFNGIERTLYVPGALTSSDTSNPFNGIERLSLQTRRRSRW
jgi:hypothetical protein